MGAGAEPPPPTPHHFNHWFLVVRARTDESRSARDDESSWPSRPRDEMVQRTTFGRCVSNCVRMQTAVLGRRLLVTRIMSKYTNTQPEPPSERHRLPLLAWITSIVNNTFTELLSYSLHDCSVYVDNFSLSQQNSVRRNLMLSVPTQTSCWHLLNYAWVWLVGLVIATRCIGYIRWSYDLLNIVVSWSVRWSVIN